MLMLDGAEQLEHLVLRKWGYAIVNENFHEASWWIPPADCQHATLFRSYTAKFSCPKCGGDVVESFIELQPDDQEMKWWRIKWGTSCSHHIGGGVAYHAYLQTIPVEKNGRIIATIVPSRRPLGMGGPLWERYKRYEEGPAPPARFGTIWQALNASTFECELLAAMQAGGRA